MPGYEVKKKQLIKHDLDKLIKHLSNFKEEDPEFKQCKNFALSQILHHSYLSVNRHEVQRSIQGLINKFCVHGFNEKAKRLEKLVNKFVESKQFKDHEEVDVEWSILLLLINLSENPTSMVLQEDMNGLPNLPAIKDDSNAKEPELNWGEFLKEGWEQFQLPDDEVDSDEWSELENDIEETLEDEEEVVSMSSQCGVSPLYQPFHKPSIFDFNFSLDENMGSGDVLRKPLEKGFQSEHDRRLKLYEEKSASENCLKKMIQCNWRNDPSFRSEPSSYHHPSARFAVTWEEYQHKHTQGLIPLDSTVLINEYKVIREILWILHCPGSTVLFDVRDDKVFTKENISIPSLRPESLASYLNNNVCRYAEMILCLTKFICDMERSEYEMKKPPHTYQAYGNVLRKLILNFFNDVIKLEQNVEKQDNTWTMISVVEELKPSFNKLRYIYSLHKTATYDWRKCEGWFCSVRLLACLYEDLFTSWKDEFAEIALELFVKSFRVYIQIIDIWLSQGKLEDWRDEFIIKRCEDEIRVVAYSTVLGEIKKTSIIGIFLAIEKGGSDLENIRRLDKISSLTTKVENKGCLYDSFIEQVRSTILKFSSSSVSCCENFSNDEELKTYSEWSNRHEHNSCTISSSAQELDSAWFERTTQNILSSPWLALTFKSLEKNNFETEKNKSEDEYSSVIDKRCPVYIGTLPLHTIVECSIVNLLNERQSIASKIMVDTLLIKFKLRQHLAVLGSIYVLEASCNIQRFCNMLFSPVTTSNLGITEYSLNILLEECVESILPKDLMDNVRLSVHFTDDKKYLDSINILDCIDIDYMVELPLSLIITKESVQIYNSVFKFLLKIEQALTSLHQLRFSDIKENQSDPLQVKKLYKLRMFLMHCMGTLHSYFVAFTPRKLRIDLDCALSQASSVEDLITAHNSYLQRLKNHCLLEDGNPIMKFVKKLLVVNEGLITCWKKESESKLSLDELSVLEDEYTNVHVALHLVLKYTVGQHSNSSLILLRTDIESCIPVPEFSFDGRGDESFS